MICKEAEKTILLVYGELDGRAKDAALGHLSACPLCSAEAAALERARAFLNSGQVVLPAGLERLAMERAMGERTPGFFEALAPGWRQLAAACAVAAGLFAGFLSFGAERTTGWQSALDDGLDSAQYGIYRLEDESASLWQTDFEYEYAALEDEKKAFNKGEIYES